MQLSSQDSDIGHLNRAALAALRGHGRVEPNPMVGCVIVDSSNEVIATAHHERFGGAHAEINALRKAGGRSRGATMYVTLEPCNHVGKTPPCTEAIISAGIARVVAAQRDPHPDALGGAERLRDAGVSFEINRSCALANAVSEPFVHRVRTGLPWVVAKWAQTIDGRIATRRGESRWISGPASRRFVHRLRARTDVILTGIGTVLADDPLLTARDCAVRRIARRVVIDPQLRTPRSSKLVHTAREVPAIIATLESNRAAESAAVAALEDAGVEVIGIPGSGDDNDDHDLSLEPVLRHLVDQHEVSHVLVEAGAGLLGRLFRERLVNQAIVFIAPTILGDEDAVPAVRGLRAESLHDGVPLQLQWMRRRANDVMLVYRIGEAGTGTTEQKSSGTEA